MPVREEGSPAAPLLVLQKIAAILDAFSTSASELSLAEIRAITGLPSSTAQRLTANLVSLEILEHQDGRYQIGPRLWRWALPRARARDISAQARPVLESLRDELDETACLFRREDTVRVCVAMAETAQLLRTAMWVGRIVPLPVGSAGRILCAWDETSYSGTGLGRSSSVDLHELREHLGRTRAEGWSVTTGERESGATGISVPVWDEHGHVSFALTVQGPAIRLTEERCRSWLPRLLEAANILSSTE